MKAESIKGLRIFVGDEEITGLTGLNVDPRVSDDLAELERAGPLSFRFSGKLVMNPENAERLRQWYDAAVADMRATIAKHRAAWLDGILESLKHEGISDDEITIADEGRSTTVSVNGEPRYAWRYTLEGENQP